ncbi:MAG: ribonuclease P protein component [Erysipelotrichia bacterium]|nr:ribonuclease P protein component [Erysipelotrichia bacterium]
MKVINRLKASEDFALAIKKGKAQRNQSFVIHYRNNEMSYTRVGISVSVKLGNAVTRNRIKRQIRNMCDLLLDYQTQSLDIVIIAKPGFLNRTFSGNKQALAQLLII